MKTDLLLIADLHYVGPAGRERDLPEREGKLALEMAERAVRDALRAGRPDALVLLGDLVENGSAAHARDDLQEIRDTLAAFDLPVLVVPGNHDRNPELVAEVFGCGPGIHRLAGCTFVLFADAYDAAENSTRSAEDMRKLEEAARGGGPVIAVQHPPLLPRIEADYPYTIGDAEGLAEAYSAAGVVLSLSGHYHAGQEAHEHGGVTYVTAPAICDRPFGYARVSLEGRSVVSAKLTRLGGCEVTRLFDAHMHTEHAHCRDDTGMEQAAQRMRALGFERWGIVEHADQLYFPGEGFWRRTDTNDRAVMRAAAKRGESRHAEFRRHVSEFRGETVFAGLECEPEASGRGLGALEEDLEGWDYLLGGIHYLVKGGDSQLGDAEAAGRFMRLTEQLVESGIDVLAHPFRYFLRTGRETPAELFEPVAQMLAARGVAAEINFHNGNRPDPRFFARCLELGVRLSIGSDSHGLVEVGELLPHAELLAEIGAADRLEEVMWLPRRARG